MDKTTETRSSHHCAPSWAQRMFPRNAEAHATFVRLVAAELGRLGFAAAEIRDEFAYLGLPQVQPGGRACLTNLAQTCRALPLAEWPNAIALFFDSVLRVERAPNTVVGSLATLENLRDKLKVRLHPEAYGRTPSAGELVWKPVAEGIVGLLVCDFGFANVGVPARTIRDWGLSTDELFELATKNVRAEGKLAESALSRDPGRRVDLLAGESHYAASHVLFFGDYVEPDAPYGAIVGVPQRHALVRHVIRDGAVLDAMHLARRMTQQAFRDGPGAICPDVFWWFEGKLERVAMDVSGSLCNMIPSGRFVDVVLSPLVLQGSR
jgi:hypothetical protein